MASAIEQDPWRVTGMNRLSGAEREQREALARDALDRLRAAVLGMAAPPRPETLAWAVDELNELAGCVGEPGTPQAKREMDWALAEVVEKLRGAAARAR